jgi:hypothetical protein
MNITTQLKLTPLERFVHFRRETPMDEIVEKWNATHKRQIGYDTLLKAVNLLYRKKVTTL